MVIRAALLLLAVLTSPAAAQVISAAPDKVAVTIYRDPGRGIGDTMDLEDLGSFALIAETRTVELPPGVVTIRFEGVAGGIIPQSAILFGGDIREKNRDAALLSQRGLIDAFTGQRVLLRRTDRATGQTVTESATIRSGGSGMALQTQRGFEAVYCSGLAQTVLFPGVPATLSPKPVLSMTTRDQPGGRVTITLAYLAGNFDWDATYIGTLSPDTTELDLFAWLTMASGDETSFPDATAAAVGGRVNRPGESEDDEAEDIRAAAEDFWPGWGCWPAGTTGAPSYPPPPAPPPPPAMEMEFDGAEIVVTASRRAETMQSVSLAVTAVSESLGDLKLYRIPVPVTVAAQSQKQVAFLQKPKIRGKLIYRSRMSGDYAGDPEMLFRFRNSKRNGAGDPLPAGKVALFQPFRGGRMLVGESDLADKAADEEVDIVFGEAANVTVDTEDRDDGANGYDDVRLIVRNANPHPVNFEAEFRAGDYRLSRLSARLAKRPGKEVWTVTVPANGEARLDYRSRDIEEAEGE